MRLRQNRGHWRQVDFRINPLLITLEGLENSIISLNSFKESASWYDGLFWKEDAEPIYGLAFIALQNYVNSSIYDFDGTLEEKLEFYAYDEELREGVTRIQLIIAIANYFKHRDDSRSLHRGTTSTLSRLDMKFLADYDVDMSPIFEGLTLLDADWRLKTLAEIVRKWREKLWSSLSE